MAEDNSHVSKTLDEVRHQVLAKLGEARTLLTSLNTLEAMFGLPLTQLHELAGSPDREGGTPPPPPPQSGGSSTTIRRAGPKVVRPDEYLGMEPMSAAKKYLEVVGHALSFDEIADAVQRGGALQGAGWRDKLDTSLMRSPYDVIKVADKTYGLATFYTEEQLKRLRNSRRQARETAPKKKSRSAKVKRAVKAAQSKSAVGGAKEVTPAKADEKKDAPLAETA